MSFRTRSLLIVIALSVAGSAACGKAATSPSTGVRIDSISPQTPTASDVLQLVLVHGSGFETGLTLTVTDPNGGHLQLSGSAAIQNVTGTSFQAAIVFNTVGVYTLTVLNPDSSSSQPFQVQVSQTGPAGPTITNVVPGSATHSNQPTLVLVSGTGFDASSIVLVTDPEGMVQTFNPASLTISPPSAIQFSIVLSLTGSYVVTVTNTAGQISNAGIITVH